MANWAFFDVGNVLFNDAPVMAFVYDSLFTRARVRHPDLTFEQLLAEREHLIRNERCGGAHHVLAEKYLGDEAYWQWRNHYNDEFNRNFDRYNIVIAGVADVLEQLTGRYKLGLAANQPLGCRESLKRRGLLQYFSVHWLSADVGMEKPTPEFFTTMLAAAGCRPEEAVMIGDRIDADVRPAKAAGMKTIWVRQNSQANDPVPGIPLWQTYFESIRRASVSESEPVTADARPDRVVWSLSEIPAAIEGL